LLELAGADSITLCDASVREGLVLEWLRRLADRNGLPPLEADIRRQSVYDLCAHCEQNTPHTQHVVRLALQLFDQLQSLHRLGWSDRCLLEYAARLHDIGRHIGFERHEHHAYYIIRNDDLRGFNETELELLALIARYHRKAAPKSRHP